MKRKNPKSKAKIFWREGIEMPKEKGFNPMGSKECKSWLKKHENCQGCQYNEICRGIFYKEFFKALMITKAFRFDNEPD